MNVERWNYAKTTFWNNSETMSGLCRISARSRYVIHKNDGHMFLLRIFTSKGVYDKEKEKKRKREFKMTGVLRKYVWKIIVSAV